jgi:hypothetical protein
MPHLFHDLQHMFGYAQGGMVPGPLGAPQLAVVHGGERVQTPEQQQADMSGTNAVLQQILAVLVSMQSGGGSSSGTDAMLSELMSRARGQRARGMVGAFSR